MSSTNSVSGDEPFKGRRKPASPRAPAPKRGRRRAPRPEIQLDLFSGEPCQHPRPARK